MTSQQRHDLRSAVRHVEQARQLLVRAIKEDDFDKREVYLEMLARSSAALQEVTKAITSNEEPDQL